jgi:hypothetical protein
VFSARPVKSVSKDGATVSKAQFVSHSQAQAHDRQHPSQAQAQALTNNLGSIQLEEREQQLLKSSKMNQKETETEDPRKY